MSHGYKTEILICCARTDVTYYLSIPTIQLVMQVSKIVSDYDQEIPQLQTADKIVL